MATDAIAEITETDDEGYQSLSKSIESAFSGVHIAVIDTGGDTSDTPAIDKNTTTVSEADIKALWEQ